MGVVETGILIAGVMASLSAFTVYGKKKKKKNIKDENKYMKELK